PPERSLASMMAPPVKHTAHPSTPAPCPIPSSSSATASSTGAANPDSTAHGGSPVAAAPPQVSVDALPLLGRNGHEAPSAVARTTVPAAGAPDARAPVTARASVARVSKHHPSRSERLR